MKKFLSALMAACVLLAASLSALGEGYDPVDFGDFSMAIDPAMALIGSDEKTDGDVWFTLYPAYFTMNDSNTNFNVIWQSSQIPVSAFTEEDLDDFSSTMEDQLKSAYQAYGMSMTSFSMPSIQVAKLDGKDALAYLIVTELESADVSMEVYQLGAIVSDTFGTYNFTGTAFSMELLESQISPLFDAISWKD